jgi:succinate dehydrogenase hydrophobic anchor subunit
MKNKIYAILPICIFAFSCKMRNSNLLQGYGGGFKNEIAAVDKNLVNPNLVKEKNNVTGASKTKLVDTFIALKQVKTAQERIGGNVKEIKNQISASSKRTNSDPPAQTQLPMEPNSNLGFWLVIGGIIAIIVLGIGSVFLFSILQSTGAALLVSFISAVVNILFYLALIAGTVFGAIGLSVHKRNPGKYRGKGKALAAIIIPSALLLLMVVAVLLIIANGPFIF